MCGFVGILNNFNSNFLDNKNTIKLMNNLIHHRGPDSEGYWNNKNQNIFFGHKRLSIVDLTDSGSQPMISQDNRFTIIFNGEIYNHQEIRKILVKNSNMYFKGQSDTETLLEAISEWGIDKSLKFINGMFAFALWDDIKKILYLSRDIAGEKPLYYTEIKNNNNISLVFGSELKVFNAYPNFKKKINLEAVNYQQLYKYIPSPYSIYENTYKVNPGTYIKFELNNFKSTIINYWNFDDTIKNSKNSLFQNNEYSNIEIIEKSINKSVKQQLLGDVEIGAFLSGGIDSSLIVSLMQNNLTSQVKTFTVGFDNKDYNEAENAKKIAKFLKTDHHELYLGSKDLIDTIPDISSIYDEPFSDSSQIPTFLISKFASSKVKVCLSGDGGDELFAGYNRYIVIEKIWKYLNLMPYQLRIIISKILTSISPMRWNLLLKWCELFLTKNNKYVHYGDKIHKGAECLKTKSLDELYYILISDLKINHSNNLINYDLKHMDILKPSLNNLNAVEYLMRNDFLNYLPNDILTKVDRAAMSNSLETRMPYLSKELIENAWKMPYSLKIKNKQSKYILKQILNNYIPKDLIEYTKKGFSIPLADWLREDLYDWADSYLTKSKIEKYGIFDYNKINSLWNNHISEKFNNHAQIWNIIMMQSWLENNI